MAGLKLSHIYKIYPNGIPAVNNFCMEIKDKEFIVFVGPSGCGKSTTLRMIAGLEKITDGELYIGDRMVNDVEPKDRNIAMVFQNYALYPHMTVYKNMAFSLKLAKMPKDEIDKKVHEAARILDIEKFLDRKPKALSGGQRQRVAIGRAIVRDPEVFLMDEPLSNLDAKLRNQMRAELILLRERVNKTFIYVTHDQTEAMTLGDRIVVMKDGEIQQIGTPQEVFNHPNNLFVAGFIGTPQMNFLAAQLTMGEKPFVTFKETKIEIPFEMAKELAAKGTESQDITLGIRPEHMNLVFEDQPGAIPCEVKVSEMMGSEIYLHLALDEENEIVNRVPTKDYTQEQLDSLIHGKKVFLSTQGKLIHLFNKNGENLLPLQKELDRKAQDQIKD